MSKILVVYYSYSDATKNLAEDITILTDADIRELVPEQAYTFTYHGATKEVRQEIERGYCPKLLSGSESVAEYDYIFIGTPNWFKALAPPVLSFLRKVDLSSKTIIPFCTHGGGGFGKIVDEMIQECPDSAFLPGFESTSDYSEEQVQDWLDEIGIFSTQQKDISAHR